MSNTMFPPPPQDGGGPPQGMEFPPMPQEFMDAISADPGGFAEIMGQGMEAFGGAMEGGGDMAAAFEAMGDVMGPMCADMGISPEAFDAAGDSFMAVAGPAMQGMPGDAAPADMAECIMDCAEVAMGGPPPVEFGDMAADMAGGMADAGISPHDMGAEMGPPMPEGFEQGNPETMPPEFGPGPMPPMEGDMGGCTGDMSMCGGDMTAVSGDMTGCMGDMTGCEGDVSGITGNMGPVTGDMTGCEGNMTGCAGDMGPVTGDVTGCHGDMTGCEGNMGPVSGDMGPVTGDMTGCEGDMTGCSGDVSGVTGDMGPVTGDMGQVTGDMTGCQGDVTGCEGDMTGVTGDMGPYAGDMTGVEGPPPADMMGQPPEGDQGMGAVDAAFADPGMDPGMAPPDDPMGAAMDQAAAQDAASSMPDAGQGAPDTMADVGPQDDGIPEKEEEDQGYSGP